jgi:hypothetical protein
MKKPLKAPKGHEELHDFAHGPIRGFRKSEFAELRRFIALTSDAVRALQKAFVFLSEPLSSDERREMLAHLSAELDVLHFAIETSRSLMPDSKAARDLAEARALLARIAGGPPRS